MLILALVLMKWKCKEWEVSLLEKGSYNFAPKSYIYEVRIIRDINLT